MTLECVFCLKNVLPVEIKPISSNIRAFRRETFEVWRCPICWSLHRRLSLDIAPYYRRYPAHMRRLDSWTRLQKGNLYALLKKTGLSKSTRFLDYGCGNGLFLSLLAEKGFSNLTGYDPYVPRYNQPAVLRQTYDVILAEDVLEHEEHPAERMALWSACLVPGGTLFLTTPNAAAIDLNFPEDYLHSLHQPYHLHMVSPQALTNLAEAASLRVMKVYPRRYYDCLIPTMNSSFMLRYVKAFDNTFDAGSETPGMKQLSSLPALLFYAVFGYFIPRHEEMMVWLKKR